jgi:SAM-dependent methyltransferase
VNANPFHDPELAGIFEVAGSDPARRDLDAYVRLVEELGAQTIVDLGAGTGTFALRLAALGREVVAVEPGPASLALARRKPGADRVRWMLGDAAALPPIDADLVTMTGNIPEHLDDDGWAEALTACHRTLRPGGHLVFGNRNIAAQPWLTSPDFAPRDAPGSTNAGERVEVTPVGPVHHWLEVTDLTTDHFRFRWTFRIERTGAELTWATTFRLRSVDEIVGNLEAAGFAVEQILDDELYVARRPPPA